MGQRTGKMRETGMFAVIERLIAAGTSSYGPETRRRLRVLNLISYLIAIATLLYALQYAMIDAALFAPVIAINLGLVVIALLVPVANRVHKLAGGLLLAGAEYVALFALSLYLGREAGIQLQYLIGAAAPFVILGLRRLWLVAVIVLLGLMLHLYAWFSFPTERALLQTGQDVLDLLYVNAAITTVLLISATVYYAYFLAGRAQREVDQLLANILPAAIVERLKERPGEAIANRVDDASVMFIDLVGFTSLANRLGPVETVTFLGTLFNRLDELVSAHGVEKIKTIGDAYMIAAGVPREDPRHLHHMAAMALAARACVERTGRVAGLELTCRIGLASGCVMAGVIGSKKFSYDVWGPTVNLAARMESHGEAGRIMLPLADCEKLRDGFLFEPAGLRDIAGVGAVACGFLTGAKA